MNKKRLLVYVVFGLFFYLLFLIVELPASWFAWGLNRYTGGTVRLDPIAGTAWNGKGRLVINYPATMPHDFGLADWRINPMWLLMGRFQFSLQTDHPERQLKTTLGKTKNWLLLKDTEGTFTASFIAKLYAPLSLLGPQGKVKINATDLRISPETMEGNATLEWQNAASTFSNVQPLGDYRLDIRGAGKVLNLELKTLRGDLEFSGQGQWQPATGEFRIIGSAIPRARFAELESLLKFIGADQGQGKRAININARMPALFE